MSRPSFWRLFAMLAVALLLLALPCSAADPSNDTPAAVVRKVMETYQAELHGIIGMQRHFTTVINAGIARHTEKSDSGLLIQNGVFRDAHYYRITRDGKAFTAQQIVERDAETNKGWAAGKIFFKEPYDPRFMEDYQFSNAPACNCGPGTIAIAFSSSKHDDQHGSGTMWIDSSANRVVKLTYAPYALPPHATAGSVTETTTEVLSNLWYVSRIVETYKGHELILSGTGTFTGIVDHFERFTTLAAGEKAVKNDTIGGVASR